MRFSMRRETMNDNGIKLTNNLIGMAGLYKQVNAYEPQQLEDLDLSEMLAEQIFGELIHIRRIYQLKLERINKIKQHLSARYQAEEQMVLEI